MKLGKVLRRVKQVKVTAAEYGARWPFVDGVTEGLLQKRKTKTKPSFDAITFEHEGKVYALNGVASARAGEGGEYQPLDEIWRDDPMNAHLPDGAPRLKVSIGPMVQRGLGL